MYIKKVKDAEVSVKAGNYTTVEDLEKEVENWQMSKKKIKVVWSDEAKSDLNYIYKRILRKTKSLTNSKNVKRDIIQASKNIYFVEQYQVYEFLEKPYSRMVVKDFKIIYVPNNEFSVIILQVFVLISIPIA